MEPTTRRVDFTARPDPIWPNPAASPDPTVNVQKFIDLLDGEGVRVVGTEGYQAQQFGTVVGASNKTSEFSVTAPGFTATVRYYRDSAMSVNLDYIQINSLTNKDSAMRLVSIHVTKEQANVVLEKCAALRTRALLNIKVEQQNRFDTFIDSLTPLVESK